MNITIIMPTLSLSGGDRVCAIYAKKLIDRGHHVNVFAPKKKPLELKQQLKRLVSGQGWLSNAEQYQNHFDRLAVDVTHLDEQRFEHGEDFPDADVVIATWWKTAEYVASFPNSKGTKVFFIQHHEVFPWLPVERVKLTYKLPLYKITISNWLLYLMQNTYQDPIVSLVPNSVDTSLFFASRRIKQAKPTVGFLFSNTPFKGVDTVLKVIELVKLSLPDLRVLCFGDSKPNKDMLLPNYFEFIRNPEQESIREIYSQCDVWLCCSRTEGFHLPPLEAMACRCPVVSTKVGGPEDIIRQDENGFLCEVDDVNSLADAVIRVLELPEPEWLALSDAALATATLYSWDDATELFELALNKAILESRVP